LTYQSEIERQRSIWTAAKKNNRMRCHVSHDLDRTHAWCIAESGLFGAERFQFKNPTR
jgi:mRNA degradation ribonuclease J1/J2